MPEPLVLVMAAFALLSVVLLVSALVAVRKRRWMGTGMALVLALLSLALAALAATISLATRGYQALTRETVAATVSSARGPAELELLVSTSGLLFRPVGQTAKGVSTAPAGQR